jgi:hypothetical protein
MVLPFRWAAKNANCRRPTLCGPLPIDKYTRAPRGRRPIREQRDGFSKERAQQPSFEALPPRAVVRNGRFDKGTRGAICKLLMRGCRAEQVRRISGRESRG